MSDVNAFQFSARNWDSVPSDLNDVLCTLSDHFIYPRAFINRKLLSADRFGCFRKFFLITGANE